MVLIVLLESSDDVESLVNTIRIGGASISDNNLSLTTSDLQRLAELSQELNFASSLDTEGELSIKYITRKNVRWE